MASKVSSLFAFVLITTILLATTWQAVARHHTKLKYSYKGEKKEPQFLFPSDGYIPGFGRLGFPPFFGFTPQNPNIGGGGGGGEVEPAPVSGGGNGLQAPPVSGGGYVPGGDDTFVPNPGFEVPSPRNGGGVPVPVAVNP